MAYVYRVLLCDDDEIDLKQLQDLATCTLKCIGIPAQIQAYSSSEQVSDYMLKSCDIAILDIDFAGQKNNGLDIARRLRQLRTDSILIFVTNYVEYAPEGYEVQACRYVLKRDMASKLPHCLSQAVQWLAKSRTTEKIQINGELIDIPIQDIFYFESQLHEVVVYLQGKDRGSASKSYRFYSTMSQVEEKMSGRGFLRVHKSYLVNSERIRRYQCREVELDTGLILSASVSRYAEQKQRFLQWKGASLPCIKIIQENSEWRNPLGYTDFGNLTRRRGCKIQKCYTDFPAQICWN